MVTFGLSKSKHMNQLPAHLIGGNFLLGETDPKLIFTPEDLSPEQRLMADTAAKFMEKDVLPNLEALEHQAEGLMPKLFRKAGELGLIGMEVPTDFDGLGLGKTSSAAVEEQLTRLGGFGVTCGAHSGIGTMPLLYFGTDDQKKKYLSKLTTGEWMAAYALSEAGSGTDALGLRTKATLSPDGQHYILNGTKKKLYCVNPADGAVVWSGDLGGKSVFQASPTAADGKIYVMNFDADVSVIQAGGTEFKRLHTANLRDEGDDTRHRSSVAISQGNLYVRTGTKLICLGK